MTLGVVCVAGQGGDGLEFFDVAWTSKVLSVPEIKAALESAEGVGEPYGAPENIDNNVHIKGTSMPPQEGDTCFRYPHDRGHCSLDHWDQNSTLPTWRAADHSHVSNEEFWYIVEGEGHVEHGGKPGVPGDRAQAIDQKYLRWPKKIRNAE